MRNDAAGENTSDNGSQLMNRTTAISSAATAAVALSLALIGCGSDSTKSQDATATTTTTTTTTTAERPQAKVAPREESPSGPNPTIATYIDDNDIIEIPVMRGDPGAPTIDLPIPEGWQDAGPNTPEAAYGAIVYTGPEAAEYTPSFVALLTKLTGNVDPEKIIEFAPGELQNLEGWEAMSEGSIDELDGYRAYQLAGTWVDDGERKLVAQKTVVIPGDDGVFVLRLNADSLEDQIDIVGPVTIEIDDDTTITQ